MTSQAIRTSRRPVAGLIVAALLMGISSSGASEVRPVGAPMVRVATTASEVAVTAGSQSLDWSGYAVMGRHDTSVAGQWTVPRISASSGFTASAIWIGIDGITDRHLIQTGTEQDSVNGQVEYYAWWEILPASAVTIRSFSVHPGDRMSATIAQVSAGHWRITITDARSGTYTTTRAYAGSGSSAEWILEAPYLGRRQALLARMGTTGFDHATINGANPKLVAGEAITLIQNNAIVATPSQPDADRDGFRISPGAVAPAPPSS